MGVITFNGIASNTLGIVVEHPPNYSYPKKDYEIIHVPGRNGDILMSNDSYQNVSRSYDIAIGSRTEYFTSQANRISEWLHSGNGYARLEDSYEPDYYRLAYYMDEGEIINILQHMGRTTIEFNCKPQRFLKSGENPIVYYSDRERSPFRNPTMFESKPLIMINIVGSVIAEALASEDPQQYPIFRLNNYMFGFTNISSNFNANIYIDCETEEIYYLSGSEETGAHVNASDKVTLINDWPKLSATEENIIEDVNSSTWTMMKIWPRWWTL